VTTCLSLHAPYRCQHAGACCAAPWQVRADEHVVAFVSRSSDYAHRADALFVGQPSRAGQAPEVSVAKGPNGVCVFREDRRCAVHTQGGESALPIGCRHYPRVVRLDRRGIALSLSHYCPTAASLLVADEPVRVVPANPPLALSEPVEGLDARAALPPLLCPHVLMDLDAYEAWEKAAVIEFSNCRHADVALRRIASATDRLREWRPGGPSLDAAVASAFESADGAEPSWMEQGLHLARRLNHGVVFLDDDANSQPRPTNRDQRTANREQRTAEGVERVIANYLAARAFGNWIAYQGRGLRTIVTWLRACHDIACLLTVRVAADEGRQVTIPDVIEGIRQADYVMLHTIDTQDFADAARGVEF
jgi:hypothetical protein